MKNPAKSNAIPASPTPVAEGFIDKAQLAQRTMMSPRTLEDWMRQGRLPYYKLGRAVRFKWSEVEQHFRQTCRVGASQAAVEGMGEVRGQKSEVGTPHPRHASQRGEG